MKSLYRTKNVQMQRKMKTTSSVNGLLFCFWEFLIFLFLLDLWMIGLLPCHIYLE